MNSPSRIFAKHLTGAAAAVTLVFGSAAYAQKLPETMAWSSYDVGSAGYAEASAMADALGRKYGTKVRIQPSGSAIGRLQPIVQKRADYGFLATETFFATEGTFDFAARRWGPQDLRVILARPSSFGVPTAADANIRKLEDLKGKRMAYVAGNPSLNEKCDALLAFAGLTQKDVDMTMYPTYGGAMSSLAQGKSDATCTTTTPSQMYELQASPRGIRWLDMAADNKKGWERIQRVAPFMAPYKEIVGAGISAEKPAHIVSYRYPILVTRTDRNADEVYAFIKALDETFEQYKNATAVMPRWILTEAGTPPADAPFHEGAIRYLKEKKVWTSEHQAWNDTRLKRLNALIAAWPKAEAQGKGKSDEEFAVIWDKIRKQVLDSL